ncbi:MAG: glycosyl hydrolase family 32 [Planctomycetota bacterium]
MPQMPKTRVTAGDFSLIYDPSPSVVERWYINDHTVWQDREGLWHLVGITHAEPLAPLDEKHLAHATAPALGGPWTRQPFALSAMPEAGESVLWAPHVIEHDGVYWMFYCGGGASREQYRIHLATSTDAWNWTRHDANPLLIDGYEARDPMVLRVGDRWVMYYTATDEPHGGHHLVAACTSDDLVTWGERQIVYRDEMTGSYAGPCESPFVFERDGRFYLFIGPWPPKRYRGTRVLVSDDPLSFDIGDQVGYIDAHALEVIVDEAGRCWCTHCGWNQGGVYLASLDWV